MTSPAPVELDLSALRRGDRQAREALYFAYREPLVRFCLRRLRDPEVAGDVVQEVFIRAFESIDRFEGRSQLLTWLCGIAWNLCRKRFREQRNRPRQLDASYPAASGAPGPVARAIQQDEVARVRRAMDELPQKQLELLSLRVDAQLSYQEMAEVTGYSLSDVKVTLHRARQALKKRLEDSHG